MAAAVATLGSTLVFHGSVSQYHPFGVACFLMPANYNPSNPSGFDKPSANEN
jgi:hypothetical protein